MANLRVWSPMDHLFRDISDMTRMLDVPNVPVLFKGGEPKVDIIQNETEIVVKADVPGVKKEDINVTVTEDTITLRGEVKSDYEDKKDNYFHAERFYGTYSRTLPLPALVDSDKASAKFAEGVLTITIPKATKSEKGHVVDIQ
ncbi:MAG: heat shock protein [Firmicutes bacterium]|nr:heat shock protein [Bacillota bacterium]